MPFPDEAALAKVDVQPYQPRWAVEATDLATRLQALVPDAMAVEHIGSTSIPGMSAKDCLDMMILVKDLAATDAGQRLTGAGYRQRPEQWNTDEPADGRSWPKMVFAPPVGGRRVNIHVRVAGSPTARLALLFRDFLRSSPDHTATWSSFKTAAADASGDLFVYGRLKIPAWSLLMELAEQWAARTGWQPPLPSGVIPSTGPAGQSPRDLQ
jgi:GrpB-like predicted nucleotidyltransferase (UPF0157 family)